jgi:hypothetical protein
MTLDRVFWSSVICTPTLFDNAEREMGYTRRLNHTCAFQFDWRSSQVIEQPDTFTENPVPTVPMFMLP